MALTGAGQLIATRPSLGAYSDRSCPAEETLKRVAPVLTEHGITRVARLTGLDRIGIPVWTAIRPNSRSLSVYQGKGLTDADARASATMEALERAVAEEPKLPTRAASMEVLRESGMACDPLADLVALGQHPPTDTTVLDWTAAQNLLGGHTVMVPLDAVRLDRTHQSLYWQSSDGLASGNTMEEAVFHALLERVERDADTLWKLRSAPARRATCFDPRVLNNPVVDDLQECVRQAGLDLVLFDMTSDIDIPVVSALVGPRLERVDNLRYIDVTEGSGAHPNAVRAVIRAITEAVQSRLTLISGARDDVPPAVYNRPLPPQIATDLTCDPIKAPPADLCEPYQSVGEMTATVVKALRSINLTKIYVTRLNPSEERFVVAKVLLPELENPPGARRQRYGQRALARLTRFR